MLQVCFNLDFGASLLWVAAVWPTLSVVAFSTLFSPVLVCVEAKANMSQFGRRQVVNILV